MSVPLKDPANWVTGDGIVHTHPTGFLTAEANDYVIIYIDPMTPRQRAHIRTLAWQLRTTMPCNPRTTKAEACLMILDLKARLARRRRFVRYYDDSDCCWGCALNIALSH